MAYYKDSKFFIHDTSGDFDTVRGPGTPTPYTGIYRCEGCGHEIGSTKSHPLPAQNHGQHSTAHGPIRWRLIVAAHLEPGEAPNPEVAGRPDHPEGPRNYRPRPRPSALVRIIRSLKRRDQQRKRSTEEEHTSNERTMARWTRRVGVFTIVLAACAIANVVIIYYQLGEMHTGGIDTHNLAAAAHDQAVATGKLKSAGEAQAAAMDKLRAAGEAQATAADKLRLAGESQAAATKALAENSGKQIGALVESAAAARIQADSARAQAASVIRSAEATAAASKSTDHLAASGQAQANAVLQSLDVAKQANDIARQARISADRPWVRISDPAGPFPTLNADYKLMMPMINSGRSPGMRATATASIDIFKVGDPIPALPQCTSNCQTITVFPTLQLGGVTTNFAPFLEGNVLTAALLADLKAGKKAIVVRTRVDYFDGDGTPHSSGSCNFLSPTAGGTGGFSSCLNGTWAY